jgi:hypothetical protein
MNPKKKAFWKLHERLNALVQQQFTGAEKLHVLPLTAMQLARVAESSQEFAPLVADLFRLGGPEDYKSADEYDSEVRRFSPELSELLKRSGYYHAVLSRSGDVGKYYSAIWDRIPPRDRPITKLYLLDGCQFARDRFELSGYPIARLSPTEFEKLGPSADACSDFFPNEAIDPQEFRDLWFLEVIDTAWTAYDFFLNEDDSGQASSEVDITKVKLFSDFKSPPEVAAGVVASGSVGTSEQACSACGTTNPPNSNVCPKCGNRLAAAERQPPDT